MNELNLQASIEELLSSFTDSQRKAWEELNGEPFDAEALRDHPDKEDVLASLLEVGPDYQSLGEEFLSTKDLSSLAETASPEECVLSLIEQGLSFRTNGEQFVVLG